MSIAALAAAALTLRVVDAVERQPGSRATAVRAAFGKMADGTTVDAFTLTNANGVEVRALTYGATLQSIRVPDRSGRLEDVVLGFDDLEGYLQGRAYFGSVVGRYANRIGGAQFVLDGRTFKVAANNGPNHLHGGLRGFDKVVWNGEPARSAPAVVFTRTSPDGEEGYPGTLSVRVTYTLTDSNQLVVEYAATTDKPTHVNLSQHAYFNLRAQPVDILGHELTIEADRYTPVNDTLIPTGELAPVQDTPFDFRRPTTIGARIDTRHPQLVAGRGYDHNWVLARKGDGLQRAAFVREPKSGRTLEVATTEPGIQFYAGNFLDGTTKGKGGRVIPHRGGFCLETQRFPDTPNKPAFPTSVLRPGQEYRSRTVFTFGVEK